MSTSNGILSVERRNVSVKHTFANLIGTSASNVVVMYNQNVGIGTTIPQSKLHITGNIMFDGTLMDANSNALWIPGSTLSYYKPIVPQSLNWGNGMFLASTSNYTHRYIGKEVSININYSGTVAIQATSNVRISVPYPVDLGVYTTDTIVGNLGINVVSGGNTNYFQGYLRTFSSDPNSLVIRLISSTTDTSLSVLTAGASVTLQGTATYATSQIANYNGIPIIANNQNFIQSQIGDVSFGSGQAPTRAKFEIVTTSNLPGLVIDQRGTGNVAAFMYNASTVLTIGRDGLFYNSNNQATWIPGSRMQWIAGTAPALGLPGSGGALSNVTATAGYRFVGTEVVYNFLTTNIITSAPTLNTGASNYTLSLPYALDSTKYNQVSGTIIGDLWVTALNAAGTVTNTYSGYARTIPGTTESVNVRYLNGTTDSSLSDFFQGTRFTLQGTLTYNSSVYANNAPLAPSVTPASFIQDTAGRVSFNYPGGTNPSPARFDITDATPSPALSVNQTSNGNIITLKSSNVEKIIVNSTGQLGIGTTSIAASSTLHVEGNAYLNGNISAGNLGMFRNRVINGDMRLQTDGVIGMSGTNANSTASMTNWSIATGQYSPAITTQQVQLSDADRATTGQTYAVQIKPMDNPIGLGAYFPFEGSLRDASGNNVTLSQTGTVMYVPGRVGSQAIYLANEANIAATNTTAANYLTTNYTLSSSPTSISLWLYFTKTPLSGQFCTPFSIGSSTTEYITTVAQYISTTQTSLFVYLGSGNSTATTLNINTWYHVTIVYIPSGTSYLYVNGTQTTTVASGSGTGSLTLRIGEIFSSTYSRPFAGYIDDFRIYNRILTATEITALANQTSFQPTLPSLSTLTSYYPLDGNFNDTIYSSNLTVTGTPTWQGGIVGSQCAYFPNEANVNVNASANYATGIVPTLNTAGPVSVAFWMNTTKMSATGFNPVVLAISTAASGGTAGFYIDNPANTSNYRINMYNGTTAYSTPVSSLSINTWYHLSLVWTSNTLTFYLNGNINGNVTTTGSLPANCRYLTLAGFGSTQAWSGYIDDVRIYNGTALTPAQIAAIYYSTNTTYTNFQQSIDGAALADFNWGTAAAMPATLSAWLKNNTALTQSYSLSLNSTGLIAHLTFENTYADAVGAGFLSAPQTLSSTTFTSTAGNFKIGSYALDLSGNTVGNAAVAMVYYNVPSYIPLPLSVSFWFKPSVVSGGYQIPFAIGTSSGYSFGIVIDRDNSWLFTEGAFGYSISQIVLAPNTWYHTCVIIDNGKNYLFLNGSMTAQSSYSSSIKAITNINKIFIGSRIDYNLGSFKGYIDDLRIYNRALTATQVKALYDANAASTVQPTAASITMPVRSLVYNTPSIPANSWQKVQLTIPADSTGAWETRQGYTAANLVLNLGAGPSYSNVNTSVWNNNTAYNGGVGTQLINYSSNNFLAASSNAVLMTGVQLEKGAIVTPFDYRNNEIEGLMTINKYNVVQQRYFQAVVSDTPFNTTSTAFVNVTTVSTISITPKFANSIIKVTFHADMQFVDANPFRYGLFRSINNGVYNDLTTGGSFNWGYKSTGSYIYTDITLNFFDSPNTTEIVTYNLRIKSNSGANVSAVHQSSRYSWVLEEIKQ